MRGTFGARIDALREQVGRGHLKGSVTVDQVYAHYQHERTDLKHPDGGGPFYLSQPLFEGATGYMTRLAEDAITEDGSRLHDAMAQNMEHLSEQVFLRAPWEFGDLRESGHPQVTLDDETIYDRKPLTGRLNDAELREKSHLRYLFRPERFMSGRRP